MYAARVCSSCDLLIREEAAVKTLFSPNLKLSLVKVDDLTWNKSPAVWFGTLPGSYDKQTAAGQTHF